MAAATRRASPSSQPPQAQAGSSRTARSRSATAWKTPARVGIGRLRGDGEDVADLTSLQLGAQVRVAAVDLVTGHPRRSTSASRAWAIISVAKAGFVANLRSSGMPAARQRSGSWVHERGM